MASGNVAGKGWRTPIKRSFLPGCAAIYPYESRKPANLFSLVPGIFVYIEPFICTTSSWLVVCNFTPVAHEKFRIGVPFAGKYKEIFNSDAKEYGGSNFVNPQTTFCILSSIPKRSGGSTSKSSNAVFARALILFVACFAGQSGEFCRWCSHFGYEAVSCGRLYYSR